MGIINATPDSFSDGSELGKDLQSNFSIDLDKVLHRADDMVGAGAVILDIGGESTRPGAAEVSTQEELDRVIPVVEAICQRFDVCISVDTSNVEVMRAAIIAGAGLINDVRALQREGAIELLSQTKTAACLMHMQGKPDTMQQAPSYVDIGQDVMDFLRERVTLCLKQGMERGRLVVDPGFGFGKTLKHNFQLLKALPQLAQLELPILVGISRKSMIGGVTGRPVDERLAGSIAATMLALQGGANIVRTHDVAGTMDAIRVHSAYQES